MVVKRNEKALEDSTPKMIKIVNAIKKIVPKKKKSCKHESGIDEYDIALLVKRHLVRRAEFKECLRLE